jgi:hypothetical protein
LTKELIRRHNDATVTWEKLVAMTSGGGEARWQNGFEAWLAACTEVHSGKYNYSFSKERVDDGGVWKVKILCPEHGPFLQAANKHKFGQGCPVCAGKAAVDYLAALREAFPEWVFPDDLSVASSKSMLTLTCPYHGTIKTTANRLLSMTAKRGCSTPCPSCNKVEGGARRRLGSNVLLSRLTAAYPEYTFQSEENMLATHRVRYTCPSHGPGLGKISEMLSGHGCPACGAESRKQSIVEAVGVSPRQNVLDVFAAHGGQYIPHLSTVSRTHEYVRVTCTKHGPFETLLYSLKAGSGCPKCRGRVSKQETELVSWLRSLGETVETQVKGLLERGEIDIYLPEKGLAIEYCGLYWHGDNIQKDKRSHYRKWKDAGSAGVRLLTVFEDEWMHRKPAVQEVLLSLLGKQDVRRARKLTLREVAWGDARHFYEERHLQGAGTPCRDNLALFDGGELVACASFREDRFGSNDYELLRYATKYKITGGFARLLAAYAVGRSGKTLVSYCDTRWFNGDTYLRNGFVCSGETDVGYWWCKHSRRHSRFRFQKHKLAERLAKFDITKTEDQNMRDNGYWKIWDCGMSKWVKTL